MTLPNIGNSRTELFGVGMTTAIVARPRIDGGLGFVFRPQPYADIGIDGHLEIIDQTSGEGTGRIIGVQIKAGATFFHNRYDGGWNVYIDKRTVHYWRQYAVPVVLTLVDPETGQAFWALVSSGEFEETEQSYKIPVPASQRLDASAADAIAAIATPAPPSLAARLALPDALAREQAAMYEAITAARTENDHAVAGDRAWELSQSLRAEGFPYEAAEAGQIAVRALVRGNQRAKAGERLAEVLEWILHELRDGDKARVTLSMSRAPDRPEERRLWTEDLPDATRLALEALEAEAEALAGFSRKATELAPRLAERAATADAHAAPILRLEAHRLNALAATVAEDHLIAAQSYSALADMIVSAGAGDVETVLCARLRALLHSGLHDDTAGAITAAQQLPVPEHMYADRALVVAWLQTASGAHGEAGQQFRAAGTNALEHGDLYTALRAFRNAERADVRAGLIDLSDRRPGKLAAGLEPLVEATIKQRTTHERLMRRARELLGRRRLHEAYVAARTALALSGQDADHAAHEEATILLAAIWRAAVVEAPLDDAMLVAIRETARTYALVEDVDSSAVSAFVTVIAERMTGAFTAKLWEALSDNLDSPEATVGALRFANLLASRWRFADRDRHIANLVVAGLGLGWARRRELNGAGAAIDLILELDPPLEGEGAADVRDAVVLLLPSAPATELDDVLNAFAVAAANAPPPVDGGAALADALMVQEERAKSAGAEPQWVGAVAMLSLRATGAARERLRGQLTARAQPDGGSVAEWLQVERALAAGIDVPSEVADHYLNSQADLLEALCAQAGSGSYGGGARDVLPMTRWAASRASEPVRRRALASAIEFLLTPGHLLTERRMWIPFIALLAQDTPSLLRDAISALQTAARGELHPMGGFDDFASPLASGVRVIGHTPDGLQRYAIGWLSTLLPVAGEEERACILNQLASSARASSPEVRMGVAEGAGRVYRELTDGSRSQPADEPTRSHLRTALQQLLDSLADDHVERIALAALHALRAGR